MDTEYNNKISSITQTYMYMINVINHNDLYHIKLFFDFNHELFEYINTCFLNDKYPIHCVFMNKNLSIDMINYFLENGCKLEDPDFSLSIVEVLFSNHSLSNKKIFQILKFLKSKKYNLKNIDSNFNSIYHMIAKSKIFNKYDDINLIYKDKILKFIKKIGCNFFTLNIYFENPLLTSTKLNNYEYSKFLLKNYYNSNNVNFTDNSGNNILLCLCNFNKKKPDMKLLSQIIDNNININHTNSEGKSCLHLASGALSQKTSIKTIIKLINKGADYNLIDKNNNNFLDYLLKNNNSHSLIKKILSLVKLSKNLKTSLILNDFEKEKYIKVNKINHNTHLKCLISRMNIKKNDLFYKCKFDHCYLIDHLLEWYNESEEKVCPMCFNQIDLLNSYELE